MTNKLNELSGAGQYSLFGLFVGPAVGGCLWCNWFRTGHMALAIEVGAGLNLQFACMEVAVYLTATFELQQFFYADGTRYLAHDVGLLTGDIAIHDAVGTNYHLGGAIDITL